MKKNNFLYTFLLITAFATFSGCLKDKGYDNDEYGIQIKEVSGVSFPESISSPVLASINSVNTAQTISTNVALEAEGLASSDVVVQVISSPTLVSNAGLTAIPAGSVILPASVTIKAGSKLATLNVTIPNSTLLDATKTYGIGISIASVSPSGYTIAKNMKDVVLGFAIKNKYDGVYNLKGVHNRSPYIFPYDFKVEMRTTGASSVAMWLTSPYEDYGHVIGTAPGVVSWYGNTLAPVFTFDPTSNNCTGIGLYTGSAVTVAMVTTGGIVNRFVPASGSTPAKMYLTWQYNGNDLRRFYDTLTYLGPR